MARHLNIVGKRFRWAPAGIFDPELSNVFGGKFPFGNVATFGGVPVYPKLLILDQFNYPAGSLTVVDNGAYTAVAGALDTDGAGLAFGHDTGAGTLTATVQWAGAIPSFNAAKPYTLAARVRVARLCAIGIYAEGRVSMEVNGQVDPGIARIIYTDAAQAASANFNLTVFPNPPGFNQYDLLMSVNAARQATLTVNGVTAVAGYALAAYGGTPQFGVAMTYIHNAGVAVAVDSIRLLQPV